MSIESPAQGGKFVRTHFLDNVCIFHFISIISENVSLPFSVAVFKVVVTYAVLVTEMHPHRIT